MRMKNDIDARKGVTPKLASGVLVFDPCICRFAKVDMIVHRNIWIEKHLYECVELLSFNYSSRDHIQKISNVHFWYLIYWCFQLHITLKLSILYSNEHLKKYMHFEDRALKKIYMADGCSLTFVIIETLNFKC